MGMKGGEDNDRADTGCQDLGRPSLGDGSGHRRPVAA